MSEVRRLTHVFVTIKDQDMRVTGLAQDYDGTPLTIDCGHGPGMLHARMVLLNAEAMPGLRLVLVDHDLGIGLECPVFEDDGMQCLDAFLEGLPDGLRDAVNGAVDGITMYTGDGVDPAYMEPDYDQETAAAIRDTYARLYASWNELSRKLMKSTEGVYGNGQDLLAHGIESYYSADDQGNVQDELKHDVLTRGQKLWPVMYGNEINDHGLRWHDTTVLKASGGIRAQISVLCQLKDIDLYKGVMDYEGNRSQFGTTLRALWEDRRPEVTGHEVKPLRPQQLACALRQARPGECIILKNGNDRRKDRAMLCIQRIMDTVTFFDLKENRIITVSGNPIDGMNVSDYGVLDGVTEIKDAVPQVQDPRYQEPEWAHAWEETFQKMVQGQAVERGDMPPVSQLRNQLMDQPHKLGSGMLAVLDGDTTVLVLDHDMSVEYTMNGCIHVEEWMHVYVLECRQVMRLDNSGKQKTRIEYLMDVQVLEDN